MQCELCGKSTELFTAMVEGTQLRVCAGCGKFGNVLRKVPLVPAHRPAVRRETGPVEQIVSDYAQRIRAAREKQGLTQQDFAKHITLKESLVHKMETGQFEPPLDLARKLEKLLHITLVELYVASDTLATKEEPRPGLTIGDILKLKK